MNKIIYKRVSKGERRRSDSVGQTELEIEIHYANAYVRTFSIPNSSLCGNHPEK